MKKQIVAILLFAIFFGFALSTVNASTWQSSDYTYANSATTGQMIFSMYDVYHYDYSNNQITTMYTPTRTDNHQLMWYFYSDNLIQLVQGSAEEYIWNHDYTWMLFPPVQSAHVQYYAYLWGNPSYNYIAKSWAITWYGGGAFQAVFPLITLLSSL